MSPGSLGGGSGAPASSNVPASKPGGGVSGWLLQGGSAMRPNSPPLSEISRTAVPRRMSARSGSAGGEMHQSENPREDVAVDPGGRTNVFGDDGDGDHETIGTPPRSRSWTVASVGKTQSKLLVFNTAICVSIVPIAIPQLPE